MFFNNFVKVKLVFIQTTQPDNLEEEPLLIEDSDETDMENGSDDEQQEDSSYHRVRRYAIETLRITRTLEDADNEHHPTWAPVRVILERLVDRITNFPESVCISLCIL